ncbi:MAG: hypothetical protein GWO81_00670 [Verrucomicrobia bacterium]|nr:hypothetical protein [Verrucomicrobiota bacterium]
MTQPIQGRFLTLLLLAGLLSPALASIESENPFLPPGHGVVVAPKAPPSNTGILARELELRGIIQIGDRFQFSLFSKKDNLGYWISEDQTANGISVRDFDAGDLSVIVSKNGRTERLSLVSAHERPLPIKNSGPVISRSTNLNSVARPAPLPIQLQDKIKPSTGSSSATNVVRRRVILPKK